MSTTQPSRPARDSERIASAVDALHTHSCAVVARRRREGKPVCLDPVAALEKVTAVGEEFGEVCRAHQDSEGPGRLRQELLNLANAAMLWAQAIAEETPDASRASLAADPAAMASPATPPPATQPPASD